MTISSGLAGGELQAEAMCDRKYAGWPAVLRAFERGITLGGKPVVAQQNMKANAGLIMKTWHGAAYSCLHVAAARRSTGAVT